MWRFTKGAVADEGQAWGSRDRVCRAPERLFIGDGVVAVGYHRWSTGESERFPDWLGYDHGITLRDVRVWPRPLSLMSVWPHTIGARTNPRAQWFGGLIQLSASDADTILGPSARGVGPDHTPFRDGVRTRSTTRDMVGLAMPRPGESDSPSESPVSGLAPDRRGRFTARAGSASVVLPEVIAHADWGTAVVKRVVATAELGPSGVYVARKACTVGRAGSLSERMGVAGTPRTALLGFDFPIGVPRAYAARAGIENFATWVRTLSAGAPLFTVADEIDEVSIERPFFPRNVTERSPGLKDRFRAALGLSAEIAARCDVANGERGVASEMFWTLGPKAVGKATLAGWRDALKPALSDLERPACSLAVRWPVARVAWEF